MMLTTQTPAQITPEISMLCQRLTAEPEPRVVPVAPAPGSSHDNCYFNVESVIAEKGGSAVQGWTLWECVGFFVEAEFHAVWRSPSGELIDVSQKADGERTILFLPDPVRKWQGVPIKNERIAIQQTPLLNRFIAIADARDVEYSKAYRTGIASPKFQSLEVAKHLALMLISVNGSLNSPCPCGRAEKFKRCHGRI